MSDEVRVMALMSLTVAPRNAISASRTFLKSLFVTVSVNRRSCSEADPFSARIEAGCPFRVYAARGDETIILSDLPR